MVCNNCDLFLLLGLVIYISLYLGNFVLIVCLGMLIELNLVNIIDLVLVDKDNVVSEEVGKVFSILCFCIVLFRVGCV